MRSALEDGQEEDNDVDDVCRDTDWADFLFHVEENVAKVSGHEAGDDGEVQLHQGGLGIPSKAWKDFDVRTKFPLFKPLLQSINHSLTRSNVIHKSINETDQSMHNSNEWSKKIIDTLTSQWDGWKCRFKQANQAIERSLLPVRT